MATLKTRTEARPKQGSNNRKLYQSHRWHEYSRQYRKKYPLCAECLRKGLTKKSECVDHIVPITQGGSTWNVTNHQALCIQCHNTKTRNEKATAAKERD